MLVGALDRIINALAVIAGLLLVVLTILICVDVTSRYFRLFALPWTLDIAKYSLYGITFFGAPWVLREEGHITIDLFVSNLGAKSAARVRTIVNVIGAITCAILTFYAFRIVHHSYSQKIMINESFFFPEWWLLAAAPVIFTILTLTFLRILLASENQRSADGKSAGGF